MYTVYGKCIYIYKNTTSGAEGVYVYSLMQVHIYLQHRVCMYVSVISYISIRSRRTG